MAFDTTYRERPVGLAGVRDDVLKAVIRNTAGAAMRARKAQADLDARIAELTGLRAVNANFLDLPDFELAGKEDNVPPAIYHAVGNIEGGRSGFEDGRAIPLVEPHVFSALTFHAWDKLRPDLSYPNWVKWEKGKPPPAGFDRHPYTYSYGERWGLFAAMAEVDCDAAIGSLSLGRFQQLVGSVKPDRGWKLLRMPSAEFLFRKLCRSEIDQLEVMRLFFKANGGLAALRRKDWPTIARIYNGAGNVAKYAPRLEEEFQRVSRYYA